MEKILIVFGTRPEAIKMAPVIQEFKQYNNEFDTRVCVTAQHREMLDQVLDFFEITPEYDLNLMTSRQTLSDLTASILTNIDQILSGFKPNFVFVHGDTTTSMAVSLAAFYHQISVCHVEAGLRTFNKKQPFPEEINRRLTGRIADIHFAPTHISKKNLLQEKVPEAHIAITGNTVIDALLYSKDKVDNIQDNQISKLQHIITQGKKTILVTGHRRENHGKGFINICNALKAIAQQNKDTLIIFPVHLNPNVQKPVFELLDGIKNIHLISPLAYPAFVWLMKNSYLIITDSGGIQEEAPSLGKPVLVMRETTERPEAVEAGTVILVGTHKDSIVNYCEKILNNQKLYSQMSSNNNPYGDGNAAKRIVNFIRVKTNEKNSSIS